MSIDLEDDPQDSWDTKRDAMLAFIEPVKAAFEEENMDKAMDKALNEAGYTMGEMNLWFNMEGGIDGEAVIQAWALVETLRRNGARFPAELKM